MDYQRLQKLSSAPGSPVLGQIYFDTTRDTASEAPVGVYTTAGWEYFGSGGGGGGTVDSVVAGTDIAVDDTDAANPVVSFTGTAFSPSGTAADGTLLASDASGDPYWIDGTNDALQPGFAGLTNPGVVSAAISASPDITFTNWPTSDFVWLGAYPMRFVCPVPGTQALSGVTSGDWAYVYAYLTAPAAPGGTPTVALHVGTSRSTAALAAADQVANTSGTIVWDGVVKNTGGTYTLTGGTPASGSVIPSAGRDRRLWARGISSFITDGMSSDLVLTANTWTTVDASLQMRLECSGMPLEISLTGEATPTGSVFMMLYRILMDGVAVDTNGSSVIASSAVGYKQSTIFPFFAPAAGSHLFTLQAYSTAASTSLIHGTFTLGAKERVGQNANNGTA